MKKYIQPSIVVKELELVAMLMDTSNPNTGVDDDPANGTDAGNADTRAYRGWNLWGVED